VCLIVCLYVCIIIIPTTKNQKFLDRTSYVLVSNYTAYPYHTLHHISSFVRRKEHQQKNGGNRNYVFNRFRIYLSHPTTRNNQLTDLNLSLFFSNIFFFRDFHFVVFLFFKNLLFPCQKPVHIIDISSSLFFHYISRAPFGRTLNTRIFANRFFWICFLYLASFLTTQNLAAFVTSVFYGTPLISFDSTLGWTFLDMTSERREKARAAEMLHFDMENEVLFHFWIDRKSVSKSTSSFLLFVWYYTGIRRQFCATEWEIRKDIDLCRCRKKKRENTQDLEEKKKRREILFCHELRLSLPLANK
jgi:hypothetical protein